MAENAWMINASCARSLTTIHTVIPPDTPATFSTALATSVISRPHVTLDGSDHSCRPLKLSTVALPRRASSQFPQNTDNTAVSTAPVSKLAREWYS